MVSYQILLRGAYVTPKDSNRESPTILKMKEQDFVARLLSDLSSTQGRQDLKTDVANDRTKDGTLRLYQPVHQIFHMALVDVSCSRPGEPRLDPGRIIESGLVVRRLNGTGAYEGWMKKQGKILGWRPLSSLFEPSYKSPNLIPYDPNPMIRQSHRLGKNAPLLKHLETANTAAASLEEDYTTLFIAPPDICKNAGKTFLYGNIPLASMERVEGKDALTPPTFTKEDIRKRMPPLLKAGGNERNLPATGLTLTKESINDSRIITFLDTLKYLAMETGLFTDAPGTEQLRLVLEKIPLSGPQPGLIPGGYLYQDPNLPLGQIPQQYFGFKRVPDLGLKPTETLGGFLRQAYEVLFGQPEDPEKVQEKLPASITLPGSWPYIPSEKDYLPSSFFLVTEEDIIDGIYTAMEARWNKVMPGQGRFDQTDAKYVVSAFIRVQGVPGCPPKTIWTEPSEPFGIVPWYESSDIPPVKVELPEVDKDMMSKLKPNVAFKVPPSIQKFMGNLKLDKLIEGKKPEEGGIEFGMICGFNIPIITLCAFLMLQIFLSLLNIIFWWLPFVRICIPFPKKK